MMEKNSWLIEMELIQLHDSFGDLSLDCVISLHKIELH